MTEGCVLAIDTSTARGSLAVVRGDDVIFEESFVSKRSHNSQLFGPLAAALEVAGGDLMLIVVGLGPGSYTGVRIAISAGQGVSLARGIPVMGFSSLATAHEVAGSSYRVIGDARRGRCYVAHVRDGRVVEGPTILTKEEGADRVRAGGSWVTFDAGSTIPESLEVPVASPSAIELARLGGRAEEKDLVEWRSRPLEPVYLEGAFITKAKARTV
jgi:tRNA threonylcarbamoyl adenosine modification protein YeaZ